MAKLPTRTPRKALFPLALALALAACDSPLDPGAPSADCGDCPGGPTIPPPRGSSDGVDYLDAAGTLRKASLQLAGRIPTQAETQAAQAGGPDSLDSLDPILLKMMSEKPFYDRVKEIFGDVFLTDSFLFDQGYDSIIVKNINTKTFPGATWYGSPDSDAGRLTVNAVAREPLELVANVVRKDRPLTEIVTARYRMVNPYSAKVFGLQPSFADPTDLSEFVEATIPAMHDFAPGQSEYAGVLTTTSFLARYPNTETNRNRKRSRYFYKYFLNYDIMKTAQRLDLSSVNFAADPWRNNPICTACHATIDPVAGAFQNWTNCYSGQAVQYYQPKDRHCGSGAWYESSTMFPPGTSATSTLPPASLPTALTALAATVVGNPGFGKAMVTHALTGLTGRRPLDLPTDASAPGYQNLKQAYDTQQQAITDLAQGFMAGNYSFKKLLIAIVKTPYFRAANADQQNRLELSGFGGSSLSPPEVLHRKIASVLGAPWGIDGSVNNRSTLSSPYYLLGTDKLRIFYGGIDAINVTTRQTLPSGLAAGASQRMAYEMSCEYVALDFAAPKGSRRLFPLVERSAVPSGDPAGADQADIVKNLQYLHERILGEHLDAGSAELKETYNLFYQAQQDGLKAVAAGLSPKLSPRCQGTKNYATGATVAGAQVDDPRYVVRAWQAVVAYLLMDYKFLFE